MPYNARSHTDEHLALMESFFERTGGALISGDFEEFAACFAIPHKVETFEGVLEIKTRDDLKDLFDQVCRSLRQMGAEKVERRCVELSAQGSDEILVTHESRYMIGDQLLHEPVVAYCRVIREEGVWLISDGIYAFDKQSTLAEVFAKKR